MFQRLQKICHRKLFLDVNLCVCYRLFKDKNKIFLNNLVRHGFKFYMGWRRPKINDVKVVLGWQQQGFVSKLLQKS